MISASDKDASSLLKKVEVNVQKASVDKDLLTMVVLPICCLSLFVPVLSHLVISMHVLHI